MIFRPIAAISSPIIAPKVTDEAPVVGFPTVSLPLPRQQAHLSCRPEKTSANHVTRNTETFITMIYMIASSAGSVLKSI